MSIVCECRNDLNGEEWPGSIHSRLVVVEGKDEVEILCSLFTHMADDLPQDVHLYSADGKTEIAKLLTGLRATPGFGDVVSLAVIRDADTSAAGAFESITGALRSGELAAPAQPGGFADGTPRVGVFIMPDGQGEGALEDLCLAAFEQSGDRAFECLEAYMDCLKGQGIEPDHPSKAKGLAFLASRKEQPARFGALARKGGLPWDSSAWDDLKSFLRQL